MNRSANILKSRFYVCPLCGNVIQASGEAVVSCCGMSLPPLEAEEPDEAHRLHLDRVEDEYFLRMEHPMSREHYISFFAAVSDHGIQFVKLYPEGGAQARLRIDGVRDIYACCNRHGLFRLRV